MSTNVVFLKDDYMMDLKPNDRFDIGELSDTPREPLNESSNLVEDVLEITASSLYESHVVVGGLSGHLIDSRS